MAAAAKVVPAQVSFVAIYNPNLGTTDETFADQLVFWYSHTAAEARAQARRDGKTEQTRTEEAREERNESLRQIGLAQGMVGFARTFSDDAPVDSVETEKSRIVLKELEQGWWILASIDLSRLPSPAPAEFSKKGGAEEGDLKQGVEYSSREVSPPALLVQQLLQAYYVFTTHHGPSLSEMYVRLSREKFCSTLDRYWSRFCKTWDVLLHGNPATDIFSGIKLASGGELGMGVGEEEWGSGEREVLEDLTRRTEGMVDCVVSRFGEPAKAIASDEDSLPEHEALPWMGSGHRPIASDGVVFGGVGAISRSSLRNVSLWMRQIYTLGEHAYGVRDNPLRERRKRRRRDPIETQKEADGESVRPTGSEDVDPDQLRQRVQRQEAGKQGAEGDGGQDRLDTSFLPKDKRPQIYGRTASQDHAQDSPERTPSLQPADPPTGVPPPIAGAVENALGKATTNADADGTATQQKETAGSKDSGHGTTMGIPDTYMKYLTFGLSELGKSRAQPQRPLAHTRTASTSSRFSSKKTAIKSSQPAPKIKSDEPSPLATLDPMPEGGSMKANIANLKRQENKGHFLIGLKGDLDNLLIGSDEVEGGSEASLSDQGSRIVLRTLQIEMAPQRSTASQREQGVESDGESMARILNRKAREADDPEAFEPENPFKRDWRRLRVLVYVRRPFIYCFLFEDRTTSLQYSAFYKELHRNLMPIHKPLLGSTDVRKVAQRIEASHVEAEEEDPVQPDVASVRSQGTNRLPARSDGKHASRNRPIFDLIFDPQLLTVHTSIPNIPEPGTFAAEGMTMGTAAVNGQEQLPAGWSRLDALNVHSQTLNTLEFVQRTSVGGKGQWERTSKTSRGWWVVWMKVPDSHSSSRGAEAKRHCESVNEDGRGERVEASSAATLHDVGPESTNETDQTHRSAGNTYQFRSDSSRIAFLVRKSSDQAATPSKTPSSGNRVTSSMWQSLGLRSASTEAQAGGAGAGWGPGALAGGLGLDARRYVEGLMSLSR
ncbi:hypothetical protein KC338_g2040 [Hortaea werneckii]|nr:hypothetical protein KC323_g2038 [Hortaea werneckii]KAI6872668.1 hypothetical protein KC338_g2040 [Hortaea werneckii]KAI7356833.1 hypothetical protein KC320_g2045 [Hortaea werneckii]